MWCRCASIRIDTPGVLCGIVQMSVARAYVKVAPFAASYYALPTFADAYRSSSGSPRGHPQFWAPQQRDAGNETETDEEEDLVVPDPRSHGANPWYPSSTVPPPLRSLTTECASVLFSLASFRGGTVHSAADLHLHQWNESSLAHISRCRTFLCVTRMQGTCRRTYRADQRNGTLGPAEAADADSDPESW